MCAVIRKVELPDVLPVVKNAPGCRIVQPHDKFDERCLPCSVIADDGELFAPAQRQTDIVQNLLRAELVLSLCVLATLLLFICLYTLLQRGFLIGFHAFIGKTDVFKSQRLKGRNRTGSGYHTVFVIQKGKVLVQVQRMLGQFRQRVAQ